ncbi:rhodanese-like domain-containing protein [Chloroflexota bacterium]
MEFQIPTSLRVSFKILFFSILIVLSSLTACTPTPPADLPTSPDEIPRISIDELLRKTEDGESIIIVDTRSEASFRSGHIKGAVSVPYSTISQGEWKPPENREIILYCT